MERMDWIEPKWIELEESGQDQMDWIGQNTKVQRNCLKKKKKIKEIDD